MYLSLFIRDLKVCIRKEGGTAEAWAARGAIEIGQAEYMPAVQINFFIFFKTIRGDDFKEHNFFGGRT